MELPVDYLILPVKQCGNGKNLQVEIIVKFKACFTFQYLTFLITGEFEEQLQSGSATSNADAYFCNIVRHQKQKILK